MTYFTRLGSLFLFVILTFAACQPSKKGVATVPTLRVEKIGKEYDPVAAGAVIYQTNANLGGSTSVRNVARDSLEWKTQGYFQRNRDLGQVFTPEADFQLRAIVLRTGPSDKAVLAGTPAARVFMQFFEVTGTPVINDNGTPQGTEALHGFSTNHRCDDFVEGVAYEPMVVVKGGSFPDIPISFADGQPVNGEEGRLVYMRWVIEGEPVTFHKGKLYAFMVGFEEPGVYGFTLANDNAAGIDGPAQMGDEHDIYKGGWSLRREGNGALPPAMFPGDSPPTDANQLDRLLRESLFDTGADRFTLSPTTDGYPDVDTYRDLEFAIEAY